MKKMPFDLQLKNNFLLSDYTTEMNEILNIFHQRLFNLEIAISNHLQTVMASNLLNSKMNIIHSEELGSNSMNTSLQRSEQNSLIPNLHSPNLTLEKQFHKLNLSSHSSFEQTTEEDIDSSINSIHSDQSKFSIFSSLNLTPNQMKIRAYEFSAIFEDAFDQLNIIYNILPVHNIDSSSSISNNSNCNPHTLNLAGIFPMNEIDKFRFEIQYFFQILLLLFRSLLLDSQKDFIQSINSTYNHLPSNKLFELNNHLKISQDKITQLSILKKNFSQKNSLSLKSKLKDHLMEEKYRSKLAFNYSHQWKTNHIIQWIEMLHQIENNSIKNLHQYETILQQTNEIHSERIQYLIQQNNQIQFNENKWYEYYHDKILHFDKELIDFRYEFNQIKQQRQNIYEEYQRMKRIIQEYNQIKINEKILLDKKNQEEEAIKYIQVWWKGIISRQKTKRSKNK